MQDIIPAIIDRRVPYGAHTGPQLGPVWEDQRYPTGSWPRFPYGAHMGMPAGYPVWVPVKSRTLKP